MSDENYKRGNQTGHRLDLDESDPQTIGDLFNPGYPDSGNEPRDPRSRVLIDSGQDISKSAKMTLGNYLSDLSRGIAGTSRPNSFQVSGDSDVALAGYDVNVSNRISPSEAKSQVLTNGATLGTFLDLVEGHSPSSAATFSNTKHSVYSKTGENPFLDTDIAVKNYAQPEIRSRGYDGNSLLPSISQQGDGPTASPGDPRVGPDRQGLPLVQQKISSILNQNRFSPLTRTFVENHAITGTGASIQRKLGVYDPHVFEMAQESLSQVGLTLIERSAESASFAGKTVGGVGLIDILDLRSENAYVTTSGELPRADYVNLRNSDREQTETKSLSSYGTMNSSRNQFGAPVNTESVAQFITGFARLIGIAAAVGAIPALFAFGQTQGAPGTSDSDSIPTTQNVDPSLLTLGRYGGPASNDAKAGSFLLSSLGIPRTKNNWGLSLYAGLATFFGIEFDSLGGSANNFSTLLSAPGYYLVILRTVLRSVDEIGNSLANLSPSIDNFAATYAGIVSSPAYRFLMSMVILGDRAIESARGAAEVPVVGMPGYGRTITNTASTSDSADLAKFKTDTASLFPQGSTSAQSFRHSRAGALYVLPPSFTSAISGMRDISGPSVRNTYLGQGVLAAKSVAQKRISSDVVRQIENALEVEYVPFYFHDIRTNEIISFHAFLESLSDSFAANYTSTAGYGRTDEVMIYNNTKRSINFDFRVVATSPEDLDVMYWNINKLVSMLYPQYSRGRQMVNGDNRFIQPFSQIATASPLIRVRIGDVIKGNYSKFALGRIFGLGQDSSVQNMYVTPGDAALTSEDEALISRRAAEYGYPVDPNFSNDRYSAISNPFGPPRTISASGPSTEEERLFRSGARWIGYKVKLPARTTLETCDSQGRTIAAVWAEANRPFDLGFAGGLSMIGVGRGGGTDEDRARERRDRERQEADHPPFRVEYPDGVTGQVVSARLMFRPDPSATTPGAPVRTPGTAQVEYLIQVDQSTVPDSIKSIPRWGEPARSTFAAASAGSPVTYHKLIVSMPAPAIASIRPRASTPPAFSYSVGGYELTSEQLAILRNQAIEELTRERGAEVSEENARNIERRGFFSESNPIVKSFESTAGKGLAGFITQLQIDNFDSTWETSKDKKAPISAKISIQFSPIHDMPLGLDSDGMMKSVAYNVGSMSKMVGGDVYDTDDTAPNASAGGTPSTTAGG